MWASTKNPEAGRLTREFFFWSVNCYQRKLAHAALGQARLGATRVDNAR